MKLRVGVIGLGEAWEKRYKSALRALSDRFEVRCVCEPVAHLAQQTAREFNAAAVDGFRALVQRDDVDAVLIFSRQYYGHLPILAACEAGKAVFSSDGLEFDPAQSDELYQQIERSGIAFMAEFSHRFMPATLRLKELIATRLGPPKLLFAHHRRPAETPANGRPGMDQPQPALHDLVQLADWCRFVVGREPNTVLGVAHGGQEDCFDGDYLMMSLQFLDAAQPSKTVVAQVSTGRYMPAAWHEAIYYRPPAALQVACEQGIAFLDLPSTVVWFDKAGRNMESLDAERPIGEKLLLQFYRDVTSLVRKSASLNDAYKALQVALAARQSYLEGRRITV